MYDVSDAIIVPRIEILDLDHLQQKMCRNMCVLAECVGLAAGGMLMPLQ